MNAKTKATPLHGWHMDQGANMASFGGYEMPLWYPAGAKAEHLAAIRAAGLFDTSHMAVITLEGQDARVLLQHCFSKDLDHCIGKNKTPLITGRCVYGVFLNPEAEVIDDAIVYQFNATTYMLVVNASMGAPITAHLQQHIAPQWDVDVLDHSDQVGKIDLQGPASGIILSKILTDPTRLFDKLIYFSFKGSFDNELLPIQAVELVDGSTVMISRTGYTGEFGFELFVPLDKLAPIWNLLLTVGKEHGLIACGLAARDSLRAGAGLPLSHQDIGPWPFVNNPWLFTLPWDDSGKQFSKDFIGVTALTTSNYTQCTLPFAGYDPRKITINKKCLVTDLSGKPMGSVLTCATDMAIGRVDDTIISIATAEEDGRPKDFNPRGLCCGFIRINQIVTPGTKVILTDGKRKLEVEIRTDIRPHRTARKPIQAMLQLAG